MLTVWIHLVFVLFQSNVHFTTYKQNIDRSIYSASHLHIYLYGISVQRVKYVEWYTYPLVLWTSTCLYEAKFWFKIHNAEADEVFRVQSQSVHVTYSGGFLTFLFLSDGPSHVMIF